MRNHACILGELSLLFALFAATTLAQPDPNQRFVIAGRVVNAATGEPISRALVTCRVVGYVPSTSSSNTPTTRTAFTDASGIFRFTDVSPSSYFLEFTKPHFTPTGSAVAQLRGTKEDVDIRLTPLTSIEGTLVDDTGTPLAMAVIETYHSKVNEGMREFQRVRTVNTDDRGRFRMWDLPAGKYLIRAAGRMGGTVAVSGSQLPRVEWNQTFTPTFHDGSRNRNAATPLELRPGENLRVDFSAPIQGSYRIQGTIQNLDGSSEAKITVHDAFGEQVACRVSYHKINGTFQVNDLVTGTYKVRVAQGEKEQQRRGEVVVKLAGGDATNVAVSLVAGTAVSYVPHCSSEQVTAAGGPKRPLPCYALVSFVNTETGERRSISPSGGSSPWNSGPVFPGEYRIELSSGVGYVSSVIAGGAPLNPGATLSLSPGSAALELEITLKSSAAEIKVALDPAVDQEAARVVLIPDVAQFSKVESQRWCRNGCTFHSLAPGDYTLYMIRNDSEIDYSNPQTVKNLQGGVRVQVSENSRQAVTLSRFAQ